MRLSQTSKEMACCCVPVDEDEMELLDEMAVASTILPKIEASPRRGSKKNTRKRSSQHAASLTLTETPQPTLLPHDPTIETTAPSSSSSTCSSSSSSSSNAAVNALPAPSPPPREDIPPVCVLPPIVPEPPVPVVPPVAIPAAGFSDKSDGQQPASPSQKVQTPKLSFSPRGVNQQQQQPPSSPKMSLSQLTSQFNTPRTSTAFSPRAGGGLPPQATSVNVDGLKTRNPANMPSLVDEQTKKDSTMACNFIREKTMLDPRDDAEIAEREKAMVLWLMAKSIELEVSGKQNPTSTVLAQCAANAAGEFATEKNKEAAKKIAFVIKAYYKPLLARLADAAAKDSPEDAADDIRTTANVSFGERPPQHQLRLPFMEEAIREWSWSKCHDMAERAPEVYKRTVADLLDQMNDCCRGGVSYKTSRDAFIQKICR